MTDINRTNPHNASRRRRAQLISDGVVASYIRDISVRHRPGTGRSSRGSRPLPERIDLRT